MKKLYKVVTYNDIVSFEDGLNLMNSEGYTFISFDRGPGGFITAVFKKNE